MIEVYTSGARVDAPPVLHGIHLGVLIGVLEAAPSYTPPRPVWWRLHTDPPRGTTPGQTDHHWRGAPGGEPAILVRILALGRTTRAELAATVIHEAAHACGHGHGMRHVERMLALVREAVPISDVDEAGVYAATMDAMKRMNRRGVSRVATKRIALALVSAGHVRRLREAALEVAG